VQAKSVIGNRRREDMGMRVRRKKMENGGELE